MIITRLQAQPPFRVSRLQKAYGETGIRREREKRQPAYSLPFATVQPCNRATGSRRPPSRSEAQPGAQPGATTMATGEPAEETTVGP